MRSPSLIPDCCRRSTATAVTGVPGRLLADRVMKARWSWPCCMCGYLMLTGDRIGRLEPGPWAHLQYILNQPENQ